MIGSAKQNGSSVYVYNEKGVLMFTKGGILIGFTSSTLTVKCGSTQYTYNEKGNLLFAN